MPELIIELNLKPEQLLAYYRGTSRTAQARATNGQMVQFPASALQRLITPTGIHGLYRLEFDANHKFVGLAPVRSS
jgi:hypothetical protein